MKLLNNLRVPDADINNYVTWKRDRSSWLERASEGEDFYYLDREGTGTTLTQDQLDKVESTTNVLVDINFIHPVAQQRSAILTQNKHAFKVISLDGRMKDYATVLDKMKNGVFYHSKLQVQSQQFIKDIHASGMGVMYVDHSDRYYPGQFGLTIRHLPYDMVILDSNTRDATCSDAEGIILEKEVTEAKAKAMFSGVLSKITDDNGNAIDLRMLGSGSWIQNELTEKMQVSTSFNQGYKYHYRVFFDKVYTTMYLVQNAETGEIEQLFKENLDEEAQQLLLNNEGEIPDLYVRKRVALGDFFIYEEVMPLTSFPLIFGWYDWAGKPYRSYGLVHFLKGMQQAYSKIMQLAILNGILTNNSGWEAPKGAIAPEDAQKWAIHGNNPMVIKEYNIVVGADGKTYKPERTQIQGLSNFYPMLLQILQQGIEYVSGINPVVSGNAQDAGIEVFSSLQQYQNAAMQRIIMTAQNIAVAMEMLGNVTIEFLISTLKKGDYVFFDENGTINEVQIADDINNFKLNKFLVVSIPSTLMPTQRLAFATELMKVAQSDPDPANRSVLTHHAMKMSEIPEADEILEKTDVVKKVQGENEQLKEANKRANEVAKQMENRAINAEIQLKVEQGVRQGMVKVAREFGKTEAEISVARELETGKMQESK